MNIWLLFISIISTIISKSSQQTEFIINDNNNDKNIEKDYTYYFETHRYNFEFNFDFDDINEINNDDFVITTKDIKNNNNINIKYENDITINVLFFVNTSSYIFNINDNISLNYNYDKDWNEIETLIITSPSQQDYFYYNDDDDGYDDYYDYDYFDEYIDDLDSNQFFENEFGDIEFINDNDDDNNDNNDEEYIYYEYEDDDDEIINESNITSRRRLYQRSKRRGRFIGIKHPRQFHDAERVCRHRYGGELASIRSKRENDRVRSLCKSLSRKRSCWVGLRRPFRQWTDGRKVSYKRWQPGEPNNAGRRESCTEMYRSGKWNDNRCRRTRPFICEVARTSRSKKYISVGMALDWDNANEYCHRRFNTELATIRSKRDNRDVRSVCNKVARRGSCWIGLERYYYYLSQNYLLTI